MIRLTKLNKDEIVINIYQIVAIEIIPESKIILTNKDHILVRESVDEIIEKIIDFNAKVYNLHKKLVIIHGDQEDVL